MLVEVPIEGLRTELERQAKERGVPCPELDELVRYPLPPDRDAWMAYAKVPSFGEALSAATARGDRPRKLMMPFGFTETRSARETPAGEAALFAKFATAILETVAGLQSAAPGPVV